MWSNCGIVKTPVLKMKEHPLDEAQTVDEALYGMEVFIRERAQKGWVSIETDYGYQGYVKAEGLELHEWTVKRWQRFRRLVVDVPLADVFEVPGFKNPYFLSLPKGSQVAATENPGQAGWYQIRLVDGRGAYMRKSHLRSLLESHYSLKKEEDVLRESLVRTALSYLHTPYRWGGKTPQGIDCSGLCSMVYLLHGISIYRDAKLKEGYPVKEIPVCTVKPGDLLYFPGHMALYIGGLQYIHSTGRMGDDGVVISSLNHTAENYREDLAGNVTAAGTIF
ncbi:C40 family peptidase [Lacrimispora sp. NSJ-141]|uniref:C40 family peptidase n=1 Tax=Lientehia hominis TaxID=2897778 RepID=A0AAP2W7P0_9FIRM|nr:SH3 domain-containing C40 family peptidase [Lientehia hominis]MCD2491216.1 C40 family peptidase [Lientehia hominis]